jgi:hypothetical protein
MPSYNDAADLVVGEEHHDVTVSLSYDATPLIVDGMGGQFEVPRAVDWGGELHGLSKSQLIQLHTSGADLTIRVRGGREGKVKITDLNLEADPPYGIVKGFGGEGPPF